VQCLILIVTLLQHLIIENPSSKVQKNKIIWHNHKRAQVKIVIGANLFMVESNFKQECFDFFMKCGCSFRWFCCNGIPDCWCRYREIWLPIL